MDARSAAGRWLRNLKKEQRIQIVPSSATFLLNSQSKQLSVPPAAASPTAAEEHICPLCKGFCCLKSVQMYRDELLCVSNAPLHSPTSSFQERISNGSVSVVCQTSLWSYFTWKKQSHALNPAKFTFTIRMRNNWQWKPGKCVKQNRNGEFCFAMNLLKA